MKRIQLMALMLSLLVGLTLADSEQTVNLTGTWEGPTYAEGPGIELTMTLVLKHEGDAITGVINDDLGYIDCEITDPKIAGGVFTFSATAMTPDGDIPMDFTLNISESTLEGEWTVGDMASGSWTAHKK